MFDWRRCNGTVTEPIDELTTAQSNYHSQATVLAIGAPCASLCNCELLYAEGSGADGMLEEVSDLQLEAAAAYHVISNVHGINNVLHVLKANGTLEATIRTGM